MNKARAFPGWKRKWILTGGITVFILVGGGWAARRASQRLPGYVRERILSTLREHFASEVEFSSLQVSIFPRIVIRGENLVFRHHGRTDVPPLIVLKRVSTEINSWTCSGQPIM